MTFPVRCLARRALLVGAAAPLLPGIAAAQAGAASAPSPAAQDPVRRGRPLQFPRDHGRHVHARIEWWYLTGYASARDGARFGFQITFFASRTGLDGPGALSPSHLLLAHAALTEVTGPGQGRHRHAQRVARHGTGDWVGTAQIASADTALRLGDWTLRRDPTDGGYRLRAAGGPAEPAFDLLALPAQPLLLQGELGWSLKGPGPGGTPAASHYYSQPQLQARGRLRDARGTWREVVGRAWLDHEWSDGLMPEGAVGWDWIGINLDDGSALMAFRLRDAAGHVRGAGGSYRNASGRLSVFDAPAVAFEPLRQWASPVTGARYPVQWRVRTPTGVFEIVASLDDQELDTRTGTGTAYWEGLAECRAADGRTLGWGYLEMTGYAGALRL